MQEVKFELHGVPSCSWDEFCDNYFGTHWTIYMSGYYIDDKGDVYYDTDIFTKEDIFEELEDKLTEDKLHIKPELRGRSLEDPQHKLDNAAFGCFSKGRYGEDDWFMWTKSLTDKEKEKYYEQSKVEQFEYLKRYYETRDYFSIPCGLRNLIFEKETLLKENTRKKE